MRLTILLYMLWTAQITTASNSFYFVTNELYKLYSLDVPVISSSWIKGDNSTVTQQCRRTCAQDLSCKAYQVSLLQQVTALGTFNCSLYGLNACNYGSTVLKMATGLGRMWDKIDATLLKPIACYDYCPVANKGDCNLCAEHSNSTGLDCEIVPKLCSDYTATPDALTLLPIWPWGFAGRKLTVQCKDRETVILRNSFTSDGIRTVNSLGWANTVIATDSSIYSSAIQKINWTLISELQSLAPEKKLFAHVTLNAVTQDHAFGGLEIGPTGALSLNASLTGSTGFPTPFSKASFILYPPGYSPSCGSFWKFSGVYVCYQRSKLFNYGNLIWDGQTSVGLGSFILSFK